MNRPQADMIRQQSMPQLSQVQMNAPPHFLPGQQQPVQQQQPPNHVALMQNANNPSMGLLGGSAQNNANALQAAARHQMSIDRRQQNAIQQGQNPQINASTATANMSHMAGLAHNPLQAMGFSPNMMQPGPNGVQVRRVQSHPQALNQSVGHVPSMHPGQQVVNGVNMPMNPQVNIPPHMRQAAQQPMMPRMPGSMPGSMSPDLMGRQGNAGGVPQSSLRAPSAQLMNSLSQPSGMPQNGLQQSIPQNSFSQSVPHPHHTPSLTSSSPRPVGHPQQHAAANMMMGTPGSSQAAGRTMNHGDNTFMGLPNHQFPSNMVPGSNRIPNNNPSFPFVPPQNDALEMPQSMGEGPPNTSGPSARPSFQPTPAQQFEQLQQNDSFGAQYVLPSQGNPPPARPPSHPGAAHTNSIPSRQMQPHQHSPHQSDPMAAHVQQQPQRPQSQPQGPPGRPPSQTGPSHTPRSSQSQLPPSSGLLPSARITPHTQPQTSPHQQRQSPSVQQPIAPRPPQGSTANVPPSTNVASAEGSSSQPPPSVTSRHAVMAIPVGLGQGLIRLLQFSGHLSNESPQKQQLSFWQSLVREYFMPGAVVKITLWKDNQRAEAKPFEIGVPILPRFFLVTTQSGVKSMTLSLDGARERLISQQHAVVECVSAVWTYKYANGYTVTLRGPLTVHVLAIPYTTPTGQHSFFLKFENLQFDASTHEKSIAIESVLGTRTAESPKTPRVRNAATPSPNGASGSQRPDEDRQQWEEPRVLVDNASIPSEPVNAFGIPQATMRCLELAESVSQMTDLISFASETNLGPMDALAELAKKLRDGSHNSLHMGPVSANGPGGFQGYGTLTSTLYSGMSPVTAPTHPVPSGSSPQNALSSADIPPKQSKPPTSGPAPPAPNQPPAPSQGGLTSTPSMASASLKRKPNDSNSPTTANAEPQTKRTRKQKRNG